MGWQSKLKSLINVVNVDLSGLKSINLKIGNNNQGNSFIKVDIDKSEKKTLNLTITPELMNDPRKKLQLQEVLKEYVDEGKQPLLEEKASAIVEDISSNHKYEDLVKYFSSKIPDADMPILRAAFYIRKLYEEGKHVDAHKQDIVYRYGVRGRNIANLCSAGYFETHIKPMYEELSSRPNFTAQLFVDNYNLIIDNFPFAVFVSGNKSDDELMQEVSQKLKTNKMYGIHLLNIHAIGRDNVGKLKELIQNPDITQHFQSDPDISIQGGIMDVQIFF